MLSILDKHIWKPPRSELPLTVHRFCAWDDHVKQLLREDKLFFSHPCDWNDPFDCCVRLDFDKPRHEKYDFFFDTLHHEGCAEAEASAAAMQILNDPKSLQRANEQTADDMNTWLRKKTASLCCSKRKTHVLMWSLYAERHTGVCVSLRPRPDYMFKQFLLSEVAYELPYPRLDGYRRLDDDLEYQVQCMKEILFRKAPFWSFEDEVRPINPEIPHGLSKIPPDMISAVSMGCQISSEDEHELRAILRARENTPELYRAKKQPGNWALSFEPVLDI